MTRRLPFKLVVAYALLATAVGFAISAQPLIATFLPNLSGTGAGVSDDGSATYINGVGKVQCYFGVNGKDLDLVTYSSGRKLHFVFNPASTAWKSSGLPQALDAEVDFYGVNFYGPYRTQGDGTTAQVQSSLQFHFGSPPRTYELLYPALASYRTGNTFLITSNPNDIPGYPGFLASDQAALRMIRKQGNVNYGSVNMPIRWQVTPK